MRWFVVVVAAASTLCACETPDAPNDGVRFRHGALYEKLWEWSPQWTLVDGDWKEDFGDAAFYGLAMLARAGVAEQRPGAAEMLDRVAQRSFAVIDVEDLMSADVNELTMAALGLIEFIDATGDRSRLAELDALIDEINDAVTMLGHYMEPELIPGYAMDMYGPTSVNGLLALLSLQRAFVLGGEGAEVYTEFGATVTRQINRRAWNGTFYEFGVGREGLHLYPNITLIILNARLFQLTGDAAYRERALAAYAGIQPLRVRGDEGLMGPGRYRSPYSAAVEGAETDDYTTLSSQNYLMLALVLLYEITDERRYLIEMDTVADFIATALPGTWCLSQVHRAACEPACDTSQACVDGACEPGACHDGILHHWIDGHLAQPDDLEYFCSGCNFQLMYILWYRQHRVPGGEAS